MATQDQMAPQSYVRDRSKPKHEYTNIRSRPDGSYVVTLKIPHTPDPVEYHVMHPRDDEQGLEGLWAQVLADVKSGVKVSTWRDTNLLPEQTPEQVLVSKKAEAEHVIKLMQMEYDSADAEEYAAFPVALLRDWKRYRIQLEKDGSTAVKPDKPSWIT